MGEKKKGGKELAGKLGKEKRGARLQKSKIAGTKTEF